MPNHGEIRYTTIGTLKQLLSSEKIKDNMLVSIGAFDGLILFRPGDCCCSDCVVGDISFKNEEISIYNEEKEE
jgi:hypothetical protein